MQLHDLRPAEGSTKARKRIGRGNASGHGTTAGRGTKGQLSRSGGGKGAGFEGGQQPLAMRLPKLPGFINHNRIEYVPVNVDRLEGLFESGDVVPVVIEFPPKQAGAKWNFNAGVTAFSTSFELEDGVSFEATFLVSGKPTLTFATPSA